MIIGFFKLLVYLFIAYAIFLFVRFFLVPRPGKRPQPPAQRPSGMMVKDEFCNTYLPLEDAVREKIDGREYFFCSQDCRRKFLENRKNQRRGSPA